MQLQHHKEQQQFLHNKSEQDWRSVLRGEVEYHHHHDIDEGELVDFVYFAKDGVPEVVKAFFILPWDDHGYVFAPQGLVNCTSLSILNFWVEAVTDSASISKDIFMMWTEGAPVTIFPTLFLSYIIVYLHFFGHLFFILVLLIYDYSGTYSCIAHALIHALIHAQPAYSWTALLYSI